MVDPFLMALVSFEHNWLVKLYLFLPWLHKQIFKKPHYGVVQDGYLLFYHPVKD